MRVRRTDPLWKKLVAIVYATIIHGAIGFMMFAWLVL